MRPLSRSKIPILDSRATHGIVERTERLYLLYFRSTTKIHHLCPYTIPQALHRNISLFLTQSINRPSNPLSVFTKPSHNPDRKMSLISSEYALHISKSNWTSPLTYRSTKYIILEEHSSIEILVFTIAEGFMVLTAAFIAFCFVYSRLLVQKQANKYVNEGEEDRERKRQWWGKQLWDQDSMEAMHHLSSYFFCEREPDVFVGIINLR